jgi:LPXTG-motif cell wall-anchored protein
VTVTVTNPDGSNTTLSFEYFNVTQVTTIEPDSGTTAGGDVITITGECFTGATEVLFDGVPGTAFTVVSDTEIEVTTPAGAAGPVDVTIVNPTECGDATVPDGFTYVAPGAPVLTALDPDRGPETGGTPVTITGDDFTGTTSVTFDGVEAAFEVISDTEIQATTPAHAPGVVDVIVTNGTGASAPLDFEYYNIVDITGVTPDSGPEAGGNTVTITGDCFTGATGVLFGDTPATSFIVVSDTQITAVVPAGAGTVDVTVLGAGECGTAVAEDAYEYIEAPVVTDLDPTSGPETGGTVVTITGEGFTGATGVDFGDEPGTSFTVVSDTEIQVTSPPGVPGVVPVTVLHPGGNVDAGDFEFLNVPTVTGIDPTQGPEDGGTVVTITGEGFTGATAVTFDGIDGTDFTVVSDTEIQVTTPPHAPATVPVIVEHPVADADAGEFTYLAGTEIDSVDPPAGPEAGGNTVTITGVCFTGATGVLFGDTPATSFTVISDTQITAVVPAGTGTVDVTVTGSPTCGTDTLPDAYEYTDEPVIGSLAPSSGPETGGTVVTITGANFTGVTSVTFDGVAGTGLTVVSDTELTVTTPPGTPGPAVVVVTSPDGASDPGAFEYLPVTDVDGTDPGTGPTGGGTVVTITGQCFTGATAVLFGGVASPDFEIVNDTTIRAVTPAAARPGAVDVTVVGAGTCGTGVLEDGFTYVAGPAGGGSLPATGPVDAAPWTLLGALLLLAGAMAVIWRRRMA